MIQPIFEKANVCKNISLDTVKITVDKKIDLYSSDVDKILLVNAISFINDSHVEKGRISLSGRVVFYLSYISRDGEVKKCEYLEDFTGSQTVAEDVSAFSVFTDARVVSARADLNQSTVVLRADVNVYNQIECEQTATVLTGGEDLILNVSERIKLSPTGIKKCVYPIEEQFEIDSVVKEVLTQSVDKVITNVQSGVGCIIVDGQALFEAIVLQNNQKEDIIKISKVFPFRVEIEDNDAIPSLKCTADARVRSIKVEVAVDDAKEKSQAQVSISLEFFGQCYAETVLNTCEDLFSLTHDVEYEKKKIEYTYPMGIYPIEKEIVTGANIDQLPIGSTVASLCDYKTELLTVERGENELTVTGLINANLLIRAQDEYLLKEIQSPFVVKCDADDYRDRELRVDIAVKSAKVRMVTLDSVEVVYTLILTLYAKGSSSFNVIEKVITGEKKRENQSAISVYIPEPNEELWSLAKRLNQKPEDLVKTNKDLCFPLTGEERIVVYRQR